MTRDGTIQTPCQRWCYVISVGIFSGLLLTMGVPAIAYKVSLAIYQAADDARGRAGHINVPSQSPSLPRQQHPAAQIAQRLGPALVRIFSDKNGEHFESRDAYAGIRPSQTGSGVVINPDGYILTNYQVVEGARRVRVALSANDQQAFEARVVGSDAMLDLALLKINPGGRSLESVLLRNPGKIQEKSKVFAVAKFVGVTSPIRSGSVLKEGLTTGPECLNARGFIKTDAVIPMEARGGLLLDAQGQIVGILSLGNNPVGSGECLGIPVNVAASAARLLFQHGRIPRGWLGLVAHNLEIDELLSRGFKSPAIEIDYVFPGSPAAQAQLCCGDVIVSAGGHPVGCLADLRRQIVRADPESPLELHLMRANQSVQKTVVIGMRREEASRLPGEKELGIRVEYLTRGRATMLGLSSNEGVLIITADRSRHGGSIRAGHVITAVNRIPTPNLATFYRVVKEIGEEARHTLAVHVHEGSLSQTENVQVPVQSSN